MAVSELTFWAIVSVGGSVALTLGGAVYFNRRRLNRLWQRLFGMDDDETDEGYIVEIDTKLDTLQEQMNEQHRQVLQAVTGADDSPPRGEA